MNFRKFFAISLSVFLIAVPIIAQDDDASAFPVTIENCGVEITYDAPPQQAITMNQGATEIMLALGLEDSMVGTAYLDDFILPELEEVYDSVPVLSDTYPSQEIIFGADPDFIYGSYNSAFGDEAAGPREQLLDLNIGSYVSPMACADRSLRPEVVSMEDVYGEILNIGIIFGVQDRAEVLIEELQSELDEITEILAEVEEPVSVFWYDSGTDDVYTGACCGAPNIIMELLGVENIFGDVEGSWATVSWEEVVARDADFIVLVNADWDTSEEKIDTLTSNPAYADMTAVEDENWVVIDFSYTTPNIRNVEAVRIIAEALYPDLFEDVEAEATEEADD
ncbi:MAG: ABC transporter substrate-binding protein [Chloroflexota bacterium]